MLINLFMFHEAIIFLLVEENMIQKFNSEAFSGLDYTLDLTHKVWFFRIPVLFCPLHFVVRFTVFFRRGLAPSLPFRDKKAPLLGKGYWVEVYLVALNRWAWTVS